MLTLLALVVPVPVPVALLLVVGLLLVAGGVAIMKGGPRGG